MRLSKADLIAASDRKDWKLLWEQALPIVKYTIKRMIQEGDLDPFYAREDLLQEGNLAAGQAVRTWSALDSGFSTWVGVKVRGALIDFLIVQSNRGIGKRHVRSKVHQLEKKHERIKTDDIEEEVNAEMERIELRKRVAALPDKLRSAATMLYFDGLTQEEAAAKQGVNVKTIKRAVKQMSLFLKKRRQLL